MNPNYPGWDYGNSSSIRRHTLVFNYVYELPFGRGKKFLTGSGRALNYLVGGWQVSGITSYYTGTPFSVGFQIPHQLLQQLVVAAQRDQPGPITFPGPTTTRVAVPRHHERGHLVQTPAPSRRRNPGTGATPPATCCSDRDPGTGDNFGGQEPGAHRTSCACNSGRTSWTPSTTSTWATPARLLPIRATAARRLRPPARFTVAAAAG